MTITSIKIHKILKSKKLSENQLALLIGYHVGSLNKMIKGQNVFPEHVLEKMLPILEVSREEFESWIIADRYSLRAIKLAIKIKKEIKTEDNKLIFTFKVDKFLNNANMSRTALSKQINHNQSSFNSIVIGKLSVPKSIIKKLSIAFSLPEDEILSWVLADKYDSKLLEQAALLFQK